MNIPLLYSFSFCNIIIGGVFAIHNLILHLIANYDLYKEFPHKFCYLGSISYYIFQLLIKHKKNTVIKYQKKVIF